MAESNDPLKKARVEYEELFKEKPSSKLTVKDIRDMIQYANEKFEKDFP
jgi:hypothetical protein